MQSVISSSPGANVTATTEASKILVACDANYFENHKKSVTKTTDNNKMEKCVEISKLCKELADAIKELSISCTPPPPDMTSASIIMDWLENYMPHNIVSRMERNDKQSIAEQYQVLVERVNEQADKIIQLESLLTERTQQLSAKEDMLQRQLLTASALETQKFEFMSAISELKLHRAALGREAAELAQAEYNYDVNDKIIIKRYNNNNNNNHINSNNNNTLAGSAGNLQHIIMDKNNDNNADGNDNNDYYNNVDASNKNTTTVIHSKINKIQPQFHSLPRMRASKYNGNNNNNNNINNNNNNNNNNIWQQQKVHENNNGNNKMNEDDSSLLQQQQQQQINNKQRNVVFASHEKIIDDNDIDQQQQQQVNAHMLQHYLQQSAAAAAAAGVPRQSNSNNDARLTLQQQTPSPTLRERSTKGLRQIFGKLRRSNSGNLEIPALEQNDLEFKRGGSRATAGGRIEWSVVNASSNAQNKAWSDWSPQEICNWLVDLGLGCYEDDCRKWLKSNANVNFFTASPVDIERELNIKMPLHRKKIMFAIDELTGRESDELALNAAQLDVGWVLRWLDDIGLPQYKDNFLLAKLDGRMLHRLTMEDLIHLHVSSCLHIASLRCGIKIMRKMNWNPGCLIRRSTAEQSHVLNADNTDIKINSGENDIVGLWTAHRVMEWLRVVDLSEYAPNLRGAGVHGALMLYESRFNANLLADLLSIPPSKTLLRRHLATHFKELLGRDVITAKRNAEAASGFQPLTITAKLKPPKKNSQFSLKRRKSTKALDNSNSAAASTGTSVGATGTSTGGAGGTVDATTGELEWSSYVCPMMRTATTTKTTTTSPR